MRFILLPVVLLSAACSISDDTPGVVHQFSGETVTIAGRFSPGTTAAPTSAMVSQAKQVCPGAEYISATANPDSLDTFLYLFRC